MGATGPKLRSDDSLNKDDIRALAGELGDLLDLFDGLEALEKRPTAREPGPADLALRLRQAQSPFLRRRHGRHAALPVDSPFNAEWLALRERFDAWQARRNRDVDAGRLAMRVAHRDFLISSPEKGPRHAARRRR